MRVVVAMVKSPAGFMTSILYCSDVLPRDPHLERLVRDDVPFYGENFFFDFFVVFLMFFW